MVDDGQKPAVISALLKYKTTESMRDRVNDALDIHGGRAVQDIWIVPGRGQPGECGGTWVQGLDPTATVVLSSTPMPWLR